MNDLRTAAQQTLEALRFYAEESHHVTLTGFKNGKRIDWNQERDRLEKAGYRFAHENHNSTEAYVEDGRRARDALNNLEEALAQQAPPMSEQKRKDGKYKVLYRCRDCGHDQWITEIVAQGAIYTGGSANWCDACDNGLPVRVDPKQQWSSRETTMDDTIRMAREAGFAGGGCEALFRFAALVAAAEREACAKVAKAWDESHPHTNYGGCIARTIRARAQQPLATVADRLARHGIPMPEGDNDGR